jgi:hypothetical protein
MEKPYQLWLVRLFLWREGSLLFGVFLFSYSCRMSNPFLAVVGVPRG